MRVIQQCADTIGWTPVRVASHTKESISYIVHVNPWKRVEENICECPGYINRGHCRHQQEASAKLCSWHELINEDQQTPEQRELGQCPMCGGPTFRQVLDE